MHHPLSQLDTFLIAMLIIFSFPFLIWRFLRTDYFAPMVIIQIIAGIIIGPSLLGAYFGNYYHVVFNAETIHNLNGIASWGVMVFLFVVGMELDLKDVWRNKKENGITAGIALLFPLLLGSIVGVVLLRYPGWTGATVKNWQFVLGIGMACSVTALPVLVILLDKLELLRSPIGKRVLRYASLDDLLIWSVLAIVIMDMTSLLTQILFLAGFALAAVLFRKIMAVISETDRWYGALIWLTAVAFAAEWAGSHFMAGAFMAGAVVDTRWFDQKKMDLLRQYVLVILMPVFLLNTGLKTSWSMGGWPVCVAAFVLLCAAVIGKLAGIQFVGRILKWREGEATVIGWLLQTKSLTTIIFANILLDKGVINSSTFTALLIMSIVSTMLTVPIVSSKLATNPRLVTIDSSVSQ